MPSEPAKLSDAAIARSLGVSPSLFCKWKRLSGCPNNSIEAAQAWKAARVRKPLPSASQRRYGNKNGAGKNTLEQKIEKWGLTPPTPKSGRKLTPEMVTQVAEYFLDGFMDTEIALLCGVSHQTIERWRELAPIKKAVLARKRSLIHRLLDGPEKNWTRIAWWLERRFPLEFAKPEVAHAIRVSNQTTTNVVQNLVISSETAEQLLARSTSVQNQVKKLFAQYSTQPANRPQALVDRNGQPEGATE
jgi:hypothetical protein